MELLFREGTPQDVELLRAFSRKTYRETFAHLNTPENMADYLDEAYAPDKLLKELCDPQVRFYFLYADGVLAAYLKLNEAPSQSDVNDPHSLEVERIYVDSAFQGSGLGNVLMERAVEYAKERKKDYIWLGVWEKNPKALAFYEGKGFYKIGAHSFVMGDEEQTDYIMRRDI